MTTDFVLWQWSLLAQLVSGALIAGFFLGVRRSLHSDAVRLWTQAFLANVTSLLISVVDVYWIDSTSGPIFAAVCGAYLWAKTLFVLRLVAGIHAATDADDARWSRGTELALLIAISVIGALTVRTFIHLGLMAQAVVLVGALLGVRRASRRAFPELGWLAVGLGVRTALAAGEVLAYSVQAWPALQASTWSTDLLTRLLAVSSSFDTLSEWLIALGCVLAATGRAHAELQETNDELRATQQSLRDLVDIDALTGLANRRALGDILARTHGTSAAIVFLDLHGFKRINDERGHAAGDAQLRRFAVGLRETFRPEDAVVRYAGDEFVVVARGLSAEGVRERVEMLRAHLAAPSPDPHLGFDVGYAALAPGDSAEDALRAADLAMYEAKTLARRAPVGGPR